jgi:hypothetical protein
MPCCARKALKDGGSFSSIGYNMLKLIGNKRLWTLSFPIFMGRKRMDDDDVPLVKFAGSTNNHEGTSPPAVTGLAPFLSLTPSHHKARMRRLTMTVLISINLLNYMDRYTVSGCRASTTFIHVTGVLPLIQNKSDSGLGENLSDAQGGLLMTVFIVRSLFVVLPC